MRKTQVTYTIFNKLIRFLDSETDVAEGATKENGGGDGIRTHDTGSTRITV